jgi:hypothetical protein
MGIELFACTIRQAHNIKGFKVSVSDSEIRTTQYADDNNIFVSDKQSVKHVLKIAEKFPFISGLSLNKGKTEAMWLSYYRRS